MNQEIDGWLIVQTVTQQSTKEHSTLLEAGGRVTQVNGWNKVKRTFPGFHNQRNEESTGVFIVAAATHAPLGFTLCHLEGVSATLEGL